MHTKQLLEGLKPMKQIKLSYEKTAALISNKTLGTGIILASTIGIAGSKMKRGDERRAFERARVANQPKGRFL